MKEFHIKQVKGLIVLYPLASVSWKSFHEALMIMDILSVCMCAHTWEPEGNLGCHSLVDTIYLYFQ